MGRQFNLKFDDVVWEKSDANLQAWKDGKTGFPIVDAVREALSFHAIILLTLHASQAMRALKAQGYMHNRCRMITAMFLTKVCISDQQLNLWWLTAGS